MFELILPYVRELILFCENQIQRRHTAHYLLHVLSCLQFGFKVGVYILFKQYGSSLYVISILANCPCYHANGTAGRRPFQVLLSSRNAHTTHPHRKCAIECRMHSPQWRQTSRRPDRGNMILSLARYLLPCCAAFYSCAHRGMAP